MPLACQASAFKCTDTSGKITFSDTPCPTDTAKGEKVMGRGAGYNPLSVEEKGEFKRTMLSSCKAPRNVCECVGDTLADVLTYEEVIQAIKNPAKPSASLQEKAGKAVKSCVAMDAKR
jgi:hypothetical protein